MYRTITLIALQFKYIYFCIPRETILAKAVTYRVTDDIVLVGSIIKDRRKKRKIQCNEGNQEQTNLLIY